MAGTSRRFVGLLAGIAGCALAASTAEADEARTKTEPAAAVYTTDGSNGETTFALTLRPEQLPDVAIDGRDHVVLVDTSASQVGAHRRQALAVLDEFLAALPPADRVCLYAVDLKNNALSSGFAAPQSAAAADAVRELQRRFPAGATNLPHAIQEALSRLDGSRPGSILYIGDGMSMAHLLQAAELKGLLSELVAQRVPVHSYAVGPQTDSQLLGSLAAHTGGVVLFDRGDAERDAPAVVGRDLAAAVTAPVFYPEGVIVEPSGLELQPGTALPMRTDRETVYLGRGTLESDVQASVHGELGGQPVSLEWSVAVADFRGGRTFLGSLYRKAETTAGVSVGFAGAPMLMLAQEEFNDAVDRSLAQGELALAARNAKLAEAIALDVQRADPRNVQAAALLDAALRRGNQARIETVAQAQPAAPPAEEPAADEPAPTLPVPPAQPAPAEDLPEPRLLDDQFPGDEPPPDPTDLTGRNLIGAEQRRRNIISEQVEREVGITIDDARRLAVSDPDAALVDIKSLLDRVRTMTDLIPEVQRQLVRRLDEVTIEIRNQLDRQELDERLAAERRAQIEAEARLIAEAQQDEEDLEMLLDRVRALMDEGRHGVPGAFERAEAVSRHAVSISPQSGAAAAALFAAEAAGQLEKAAALRSLRSDKFLEALHLVELSGIPFPDEPPVVWPPAEVWQALTERRRKWNSVSLESTSPSEERIRSALVDPQGVEIDFVDQPLKEAMEFLADAHGITIILDEQALTDEGVQTDEPLNHVLSGITLRSALKIMLEPLGLTYVIEDEVMKITTKVAADEKLSTRVYPVGDLVVQMTPMIGGGGGGGFGGGGQGGFGGGGQGGFGGGGQGGFGGGGQGGGGGFFSVPTGENPQQEAAPTGQPNRFDNATIDSLKKKPRTVR